MGRAIYSQSYAPVIRDPSPAQYEKWSISNPFDPDSDEFFEEAQYEAFLPMSSSNTRSSTAAPPAPTSTDFLTSVRTRTTVTRGVGPILVNPNDRNGDTSAGSNPMVLDSVPHDLPEMPVSSQPPPIFQDSSSSSHGDVDPRPVPSPMAVGSDSEDPMRILAALLDPYRAELRSRTDGTISSNVTDMVASVAEQWRRESEELHDQDSEYRPQRYLPPLSYPSSSSSSSSSRADSPSSPIYFPSPPSLPLPSPPPMTRQLAESGSGDDFAFDFNPLDDEELRLDMDGRELELQDSNELQRFAAQMDSLFAEDSAPLNITAPPQQDSAPGDAAASVPVIPISESRTPPRAIRIHRRVTSNNDYGNGSPDVGIDMSPPPSVSPRLYNWARSDSDSLLRHAFPGSGLSASPVARADLGAARRRRRISVVDAAGI